MKFRYTLFLVFVAILAVLTMFVLPNGYDVERAGKARDQVEAILVKSGCLVNLGDSNGTKEGIEVMMTEVRGKVVVGIGNPKPDEKTILNIIYNHRHEIDGETLGLIFKNEQNVLTSRVWVSD